MRVTLAGKFKATIVGTLLLAALSSLAALFAAWHTRRVTEGLLVNSLEDYRAVAQLEISLLEQRGFISEYLLEGHRRPLEELERREPGFYFWLERVGRMADTAEVRAIVTRIGEVFRRYDVKRDEVITLYQQDRVDEAKRLFLSEVNPSYVQAYRLCEDLVAARGKHVQAAMDAGRRQIRWLSFVVAVCVFLTLGLGLALLWFFSRSVLRPLRRMAADAGALALRGRLENQETHLEDELKAVGFYLQTLMSDVEQTRASLERSQSQLVNAEKLASVGKLAASVAHEIRNPLTAINMRLFSVQRALGEHPLYEDDLRVIAEEIARLERIIRNFLDFTRPPEPSPRPTPVGTLLDKILELFRSRAEAKNVRFHRDEASQLPQVVVDPDQIKQVLINLLNNALEATRNGGAIGLAAATETDADGRAFVVVRVKDSGAGIAPDIRNRIFEPFFTTKDEGTGLGLCIAARIMARHGGRLKLESSTAEGTTFAVYLPATRAEGDGPDTRR